VQGARRGEAGDLERVTQLAEAAATELAGQRGGSIWVRREARPSPQRDGLAAMLTDSEAHLVVGTIDGTVVGYGVARLEPLHDGAVLGVVSDLYVEPEARGVGVGESMMTDLVAWCEDRGCVGVDSLALPGDRATKNFFESFGLVARAIVVHRRLR
jgi:ribosomal protein S18 acetylase RimI-like enzyme